MARRHNATRKAKKIKARNKSRIQKGKQMKLTASVTSVGKYIRNLSDAALNHAEITALGKGLKYVPIPHLKLSEIMNDFKITERRMRLKVQFSTSAQKDKHPFKIGQAYTPLTSESNSLEDYLYATKLELAKLSIKKGFNLNKSERLALQNLRKIQIL